MTKTNDSRFLQHMLGLACIATLSASCTTDVGQTAPDAAAMEVDPTGNWNITYMMDAGCGQPAAVAMGTFTVTQTPQGYAVSAAGVTTTGTLICTLDHCKLSGMFAWSDATSQFQQNVNIVLDAHTAIAGNGTQSVVTGTSACSITFTVQGKQT